MGHSISIATPPVGGLVLLGAVLVGACGSEAPVVAPPVAAEPAPLTEVEMVAIMENHYLSAISAHDSLIRNDLPAFRGHLARLAGQELPSNAPEGWKAPHGKLRDAARGAEGATELARAGAVMGEVAGACGACHVGHINGPLYQDPAAPLGADAVSDGMMSHQWATERLWEGVTGPRDDAWTRGAAALAQSSVFVDAPGSSLHEREQALRTMGEEARSANTLAVRTAAYGRLLATCAACHDDAGVDFSGR